jgi:hypothetical protein
MSLNSAILQRSEKVSNALETLKATRRFSQDKVTDGLYRVDRYVEDVEGDWLENWSNEGLEGSVSNPQNDLAV